MDINDIVKELIAIFNTNGYELVKSNDFKSMLSEFVNTCVNNNPIGDLHTVECCFDALYSAKAYITEHSTEMSDDELQEFSKNILSLKKYIKDSVINLVEDIGKIISTQKDINKSNNKPDFDNMSKADLINYIKDKLQF